VLSTWVEGTWAVWGWLTIATGIPSIEGVSPDKPWKNYTNRLRLRISDWRTGSSNWQSAGSSNPSLFCPICDGGRGLTCQAVNLTHQEPASYPDIPVSGKRRTPGAIKNFARKPSQVNMHGEEKGEGWARGYFLGFNTLGIMFLKIN